MVGRVKEMGYTLKIDDTLKEYLVEKGYDENGKVIVAINPTYYRPTEVDLLLGDASKANEKLGWKPKITFDELVTEMVLSELKVLQK